MLAAWLADPRRAQGAARRQGAAAGAGRPRAGRWPGVATDTALAAYLVRPDQRSFDLEDLVLRHLGRELQGRGRRAGDQGMLDFAADGDTAEAQRRDGARARGARPGAVPSASSSRRPAAPSCCATSSCPLVEILARMERTGIAVDEPTARRSSRPTSRAKVREAQEDAYDAIGGEHDQPRQPKQLQEVLFDQLGMPKTKRTKTGYTTDADALADLFTKTEHPFLEALLRHRDASRLRVTVEGLHQVGGRRPAASTRPTSRRSPPPAGCRRPTPTCRTSRSAPRRAAASARSSSSARASSR